MLPHESAEIERDVKVQHVRPLPIALHEFHLVAQRLQRLLKKHGFALAETCYVGDETRDIEAARGLGMRMVAVGWGFSAPELLSAKEPDHLLTHPSELLSLV